MSSPHHIIPEWVLMTDPRMTDPIASVGELPDRSMVIYRHFGAKDCLDIADALREVCTKKNHLFIVGQDVALAVGAGAAGVHLPEREMGAAAHIRSAHPNWFISCAVHDENAILAANKLPLNAVILSSIFASASPSASASLGIDEFARLAELSLHPVIALGGITMENAGLAKNAGAIACAGVSMFKT